MILILKNKFYLFTVPITDYITLLNMISNQPKGFSKKMLKKKRKKTKMRNIL